MTSCLLSECLLLQQSSGVIIWNWSSYWRIGILKYIYIYKYILIFNTYPGIPISLPPCPRSNLQKQSIAFFNFIVCVWERERESLTEKHYLSKKQGCCKVTIADNSYCRIDLKCRESKYFTQNQLIWKSLLCKGNKGKREMEKQYKTFKNQLYTLILVTICWEEFP